MHLNKKGWGLREMIVLSAILIIFLIITIYYIYTFYSVFEKDVTNNYSELEEKLENQALIYLSDYYTDNLSSEKIKITRNVLKAYDLDVYLADKDGDACSGYVEAYKTHGKVFADAYIKCNDYMTKGYEY